MALPGHPPPHLGRTQTQREHLSPIPRWRDPLKVSFNQLALTSKWPPGACEGPSLRERTGKVRVCSKYLLFQRMLPEGLLLINIPLGGGVSAKGKTERQASHTPQPLLQPGIRLEFCCETAASQPQVLFWKDPAPRGMDLLQGLSSSCEERRWWIPQRPPGSPVQSWAPRGGGGGGRDSKTYSADPSHKVFWNVNHTW